MKNVVIECPTWRSVIAEAGAMNFMEDRVGFQARMGD